MPPQAAGEVPIGAVILFERRDRRAGAKSRAARHTIPRRTRKSSRCALAAQRIGNYRLTGASLCHAGAVRDVRGAMIHARLDRLIFAADDPKAGAAGSVLEVLNHPGLNHQMTIDRGLLAGESTALLREFFQRRRSSPAV